MKSFCTSCIKITFCEIGQMVKVAPESVGNGKYNYDKTTKCLVCGELSVSYLPAY